LTLASASDGKRDIGSNPVLVVPAGSNAQWVGYWGTQTGGVFLGFVPLGGKDYPYTVQSDLFTINAPEISLVNGDRVVFMRFAPGAITLGDPIYFARDVNGSAFRIASSIGGAALPLSHPAGRGTVGKITPLSFPNGGAITVNQSTFDFGPHATNSAPIWQAQTAINLNVSQTFDLDTICSDPDGGTITYSLDPSSTTGGVFSIASNGVITGLAAGTRTVIVRADDGQG